MELFEHIRREYELGVGSVAGVARKFGVHRRMVREALAGPIPAQKPPRQYDRPRIGPLAPFIDAILEEDRQAPRKQRHTAHRIYVRLRQEMPDKPIAEPTVRRYVRERKKTLGLAQREAQVDWYDAVAEVDGERVKLEVFSMRSMASGASFHRAYRRATQQAFLEGHELAFIHLGGCFARLRYDNLTSAVKKILRGSRREETQRFVAFRSHWGFQSTFCRPGEEGAHEKGGIESECGYFGRNHWAGVPKARDLEDLNQQLLAGCREDEGRKIDGRTLTVGATMLLERMHLRPLPTEGFELAEWSFPVVSKLGTVTVRTNRYSAPLAAGTAVQAKITPTTIEIQHGGRVVARHERCYSRQHEILDLEHYLDVLERKPGALAGSKPLEQWRRAGRWPDSFDRFWEALTRRHGTQAATRDMIRLLRLGQAQGYDRLRAGIEQALALGCHDAAAVEHLMGAAQLGRVAQKLDVGALLAFNRPPPGVGQYDQLLAGGQ